MIELKNMKRILTIICLLVFANSVFGLQEGKTINDQQLLGIDPWTVSLESRLDWQGIVEEEGTYEFRVSAFDLERTRDVDGEIIDGNYTVIRKRNSYQIQIIQWKQCLQLYDLGECTGFVEDYLRQLHVAWKTSIRWHIFLLQIIAQGFDSPGIGGDWDGW